MSSTKPAKFKSEIHLGIIELMLYEEERRVLINILIFSCEMQ